MKLKPGLKPGWQTFPERRNADWGAGAVKGTLLAVYLQLIATGALTGIFRKVRGAG